MTPDGKWWWDGQRWAPMPTWSAALTGGRRIGREACLTLVIVAAVVLALLLGLGVAALFLSR